MFKTILKIAVLSATAITLLSACGAATKALNDALRDIENRAHSADTQNNIDDNGNPIPVDIDDFGNPILAAPTTADICSGKHTWQLWESPCDNDEASIQRLHEYCLNDPWMWEECIEDDRYDDARHEYCLNNPFYSRCVVDDRYNDTRHESCLNHPFSRQCVEDNRYQNARLETCAVDFRGECADGGLEFYPALIKFCNKPANAGHDACVTPSEEPHVDSHGYTYNQFLQGTADGLNTGSLHASTYDATAPVVHILKLSDSDDGVAFFRGGMPVPLFKSYYVVPSFYVGILPDPNLGAPITQTGGTATWQGSFSVIRTGDIRRDTDFDLEIDFAKTQLSAFISVANAYDANDNNLVSDYHLSGAFSDGKIEGDIHATYEFSNGARKVKGRVQGLIGQDGAVAVFITQGSQYSYAGGFVARPPSK